MKMQDLIGLTDAEVRDSLQGNPFTNEIADIYSEALTANNATIAVAAQEELYVRGDTDLIEERFTKACDTVKIELGSSLSNALAESFIKFRDYDFLLSKCGEFLRRRSLLLDRTSTEGTNLEADDDFTERFGKYINLGAMIHSIEEEVFYP